MKDSDWLYKKSRIRDGWWFEYHTDILIMYVYASGLISMQWPEGAAHKVLPRWWSWL